MCAKLPRELRNMVYMYLIPARISVNDHPPDHISKPATHPHLFKKFGQTGREIHWVPYRANAPCTRADRLCNEAFWNEEVTGLQVTEELMDSWYCTTEFVIPWKIAVLDLPFAELDRFKAGHDPRTLIMRVTREIAVHDMFERIEMGSYTKRYVAPFQSLMSLGGQARVHVLFMMGSYPFRDNEETLRVVLEWLREAVLQMMESGPALHASIEYQGPRTAESQDRMSRAVSDWVQDMRATTSVRVSLCQDGDITDQ